MKMLQEDGIGWDPIHLWTPVEIATKIYMVFLLAVLVVAIVKLVKVWIGAPPFRLKRQAENPDYLRILERSRRSTKQWIDLTGLFWAFVFAYEVANFAIYADESKIIGLLLLLTSVRKLGVLTEMAAFTALILFLIQWHMFSRAEQLRTWAAKKVARSDSQAVIK
jgi:hypothetical protein